MYSNIQHNRIITFSISLFFLFSYSFLKAQSTCPDYTLIGHDMGVDMIDANSYILTNWGGNITNIGDINGDGIDDIAVGTPDQGACVNTISSNCYYLGAMTVLLMNADGSVNSSQVISEGLGGFSGISDSQSDFGGDVVNIGDLNNDGVDDLVVADASFIYTNPSLDFAGNIHVLFMNADGTVASSYTPDYSEYPIAFDSYFADVLITIDDVDGDGIPEMLTSDRDGYVYLLSINANGTIKNLSYINTSTFQPNLSGFSNPQVVDFERLGDFDGDGVEDFILGIDGNGGEYIIWYMNADGTVKIEQNITDPSIIDPEYGFSNNIEVIPDFNGDGVIDLMISDPGYEIPGTTDHIGAVHFVSLNADGTMASSKTLDGSYFDLPTSTSGFGTDWFGRETHYLGDVDNDGFFNIWINANFYDQYGVPDVEGVMYSIDVMCVDGEFVLQEQCPDEIINIIAANVTEVCLNDNIPNITNVTLANGGGTGYFSWEMSTDGGGSWDVIPGATTLEFSSTVSITGTTQIRRVYEHSCCLADPVYSNVVTINIQGEAPEVNILPKFYCPLTAGSSAFEVEVTGGTGPFTYSWSPSTGLDNATSMTPTVTYGTTDSYTLIVTGSDGCSTEATGLLFPIQADAGGALTYICEEGGVQIGMSPIPSLNPITYSWIPTTGLSCSDCPDPIANPTAFTTYTLTVDDGSGCETTSSINVNPNGFEADAGNDIYVCQGTDVTIGNNATQAGVFYGWAPGLYINNQITAQPTFFSGVRPDPNPFTYTLTTFDEANGGCYSVDTMLAHVAWADAGPEDVVTVCGTPIQIGTPDCCNGQATYEWTTLSGDAVSFVDPNTGLLTSSSNIPMPYVLPTTQCTEYQVTVRWGPNADNTGGAVCTDSREVCVGCGDGCPVIDVAFDEDIACGLGTAGNTMRVPLDPEWWNISWSPGTNLSCTDCMDPVFTSNITSDITYTATYTSKADPTISCFFEVEVFNSASAFPIATAQGGWMCPSGSLQIGGPPVVGWSYSWSSTFGLDDALSSNPTVSGITSSRNYTLTVSDDVTGCSADTTIRVGVLRGSDLAVFSVEGCVGDQVSLGADPIPGVTYSWTPTTGLDNPNSANPTLTISNTTATNYSVSATGFGCTETDDVDITVYTDIPYEGPNPFYLCEGAESISIGIEVNWRYDTPEDITYAWSPSTGLSSTSGNPVLVSGLTTSTTYTVTMTSGGGGCVTEVPIEVNVTPNPTATLPDIEICDETMVTLGPTTPDANIEYYWDQPETLDDATRNPNPIATIDGPTTYTVSLVDQTSYCIGEATQNIVLEGTEANAGPDFSVCESTAVTLGLNAAEAGTTYSWSPALYLDDPNIAQPTATPENTITYVLTTTKDGCSDSDTVSILVTPGVEFDLRPYSVVCAGGCGMIGVPFDPAYTYEWFPADAVSSPTLSMTEVCPTSSTTVYLTITDPVTGCSETQSTIITPIIFPNNDMELIDGLVCVDSAATIDLLNSELNVNYQLRDNTNDNPIGAVVVGTGGTISFQNDPLNAVGSYEFNVLAMSATTDCEQELIDIATVTVEVCDYPTMPRCDAPACHFTSNDLYLGTAINSNNDQGVSFPNDIHPSNRINLPVSIYNNTGSTAYLNVWVDWNSDGDFIDAGEQIASETYPYASYNGSFLVSLPTIIPSTIVLDSDIDFLFRLSTDESSIEEACEGACSPDGEVEDYQLRIGCKTDGCFPVIIQN